MRRYIVLFLLLAALLASCAPSPAPTPPPAVVAVATPRTTIYPTRTRSATWTPGPSRTPIGVGPTLTPTPAGPPVPTPRPSPPEPSLSPQPLATAAEAGPLEIVGRAGGGSIDNLAVEGSYLYAVQGPNLVVWDVADLVRPSRLGDTPLALEGKAKGIHASDGIVYVATTDHTVQVIDASDPTAPVSNGACETSNLSGGWAARNGYIYLVEAGGGLQVIDARSPADCAQVAHLPKSLQAEAVVIAGQYAYVTANQIGLQIYDLDDPTAPVLVGQYQAPKDWSGYLCPATIAGDYAYLPGDEKVLIVDISNPQAPMLVGQVSAPGEPAIARKPVYAAGHFLYFPNRCFDVSNPAAPVESENGLTDWNKITGIEAWGDLLYVLDWQGLRVIDSAGSEPQEVALLAPLVMGWGIAVQGGYAYIAQGEDGSMGAFWGQMATVDISDPAQPQITDHRPLSEIGQKVATQDGYAYVATARCEFGAASCWGSLLIYNLDDPASPSPVGKYELQDLVAAKGGSERWGVADVQVWEDYAYLIGGPYYENPAPGTNYGLVVVDISNPAAPVRAGAMALPPDGNPEDWWTGWDLAISENYAYAAAEDKGFRVVDISDPTAPAEVGSLQGIRATRLALAGRYAYVAGAETLWVLDLADIAHPTAVARFELPGDAQEMMANSGKLYIAFLDAGLYVLDISNPVAPIVVNVMADGSIHSITVSPDGKWVYLLDSANGLSILSPGQ